jgi:hypothetical protein
LSRPAAILFDLKAPYRLSSHLSLGGLVEKPYAIIEIESMLGRNSESNAEAVSSGFPLEIVARTNTVAIGEPLRNGHL